MDSVRHTKYAESTINVFAPAWMGHTKGIRGIHGITPMTE